MSSTVVTIVWPHGGTKVQVAGDFSDWQPVDMKASDDQLWSVTFTLSPGTYEFKFVVDGNWVHDPDQEQRLNSLGSQNNIVIVADVEHREQGRSESPLKMSTSSSDESDEEWEMVEKGEVSKLEKLEAKLGNTEIERKFTVPENYADLLAAHGFNHVQEFEEILSDQYFDTADHDLLRKDFWLRQRNGDWELKYPIVGNERSEHGSTLYHETSYAGDIISLLRSIIPTSNKIFEGSEGSATNEDLNVLLKSGALKPFARLKTDRHWYQKDNITVVIDDTDWGFRVGEIEMVISDESQITNALDKIDDVARQLNFSAFNVISSAETACASSSSA